LHESPVGDEAMGKPQEPEAVKAEIEKASMGLGDLVETLTVSNPQEYEGGGKLVKSIKEAIKVAKEKFAPLKEAAHLTHKRICGLENEVVQPLQALEREARKKIDSYLQEQERIRREAQEKAEAEARRKAEAERKELERRAAAAKKAETKERLQEEAQEVEAAPVVVEPEVQKTTRTEGATLTAKKDVEVGIADIDLFFKGVVSGAVPKTMVSINLGALKRWVKTVGMEKGEAKKVGISITEKMKSQIR